MHYFLSTALLSHKSPNITKIVMHSYALLCTNFLWYNDDFLDLLYNFRYYITIIRIKKLYNKKHEISVKRRYAR
jgi:hypothetical protein